MNQQDVFRFTASRRLAAISMVNAAGCPEAALIGFAFDPALGLGLGLGLIFDTSSASRKARNLRACPEAALVVGWDDETTVQLESVASELSGADLLQAKAAYVAAWPDGRARKPGPIQPIS